MLTHSDGLLIAAMFAALAWIIWVNEKRVEKLEARVEKLDGEAARRGAHRERAS